MPDEITPDPAAPSGVAEVPSAPPVEPVATPPAAPESPVAPVAPEAPVEPDPLASELEGEAAHALRETRESVDTQEAAANVHADSIANHTVGLLHEDAYIQRAPDVADAGPRWEQVHTSLTAE